MRVEIDKRADAVIKIDGIMHRTAGLHAGRMPWLQRLRHQSANEPIAHRLAEKRVSLARCAGGHRPMWKWRQLLLARDFYSKLRLNVIRILSRRVETWRNPNAQPICHQRGQPCFNVGKRSRQG